MRSVARSIDKRFLRVRRADVECIRGRWCIPDQVAVNREVAKVIIGIFKCRDLKVTMLGLHEAIIQYGDVVIDEWTTCIYCVLELSCSVL